MGKQARINARAMQGFRGVNVAESQDFGLIEQGEFDGLFAALKNRVQMGGGEFLAERFGSKFAQMFGGWQLVCAREIQQPKLARVYEQQLFAVVQPKPRVRMLDICLLVVQVQKPPGHSQMHEQTARVVEVQQNMFAAPRHRINARLLKPECELTGRIVRGQTRQSKLGFDDRASGDEVLQMAHDQLDFR